MQHHTLVFIISASLLTACGSTTTLCGALKDQGFTCVETPRKTIAPGTLYDSANPGAPVCWSYQAYPGLPESQTSETVTMAIRSSFAKSFGFDADAMDKIRAKAAFSMVENIDISIQNAVVVENSFTDLYKGKAQRDPDCTKVVNKLIEQKHTIKTVLRALRADVVYSVQTGSRSSTDLAGILGGLTAELGGSSMDATTQTISGASLYYGWDLADFDLVSGSGPSNAADLEARKKRVQEPVFFTSDKSLADLAKEGTLQLP
jgi:hypothetical protein